MSIVLCEAVNPPIPLLLRSRARLVGATIIGSVFLGAFGTGFAPVDILIAILAVPGIILARRERPTRLLQKGAVVPLYFFLLGSLISFSAVGFAHWGLMAVAIDVLLIAMFYGVVFYGSRLRKSQWKHVDRCVFIAFGIVATSVLLLGAGQYRPSGTFANPNYAGHWCAVAALFIVLKSPSFLIRGVTICLASAVLLRTGSFGSSVILVVGLLIASLRVVRRKESHAYWRMLTLALAVGSTFVIVEAFKEFSGDPSAELSTGVSSARFGSSANGRASIWTRTIALIPDNPLGVGPHGVASRNLIERGVEVHNDYLALIVERGVLGAAGFASFIFVLWRRSLRRGVFRNLLVPLLVGGLFRETLHFRHLWLFLALAMAWDWQVDHSDI